MDVFLETRRLRLRRFTPGDGGRLFALDSDPEVMRYLTGGAGTSREHIENEVLPAMIAAYDRYGGLGWWAAETAGEGGFVGWFGLHPFDTTHPGELELGYRLRREAWGRGLATEGALALLAKAFEEFGATRVVAQTYEENVASRRVLEKCGMRFVRSFRVGLPELVATSTYDASAAEPFAGDDVEYAVDRADWLRARGGPEA